MWTLETSKLSAREALASWSVAQAGCMAATGAQSPSRRHQGARLVGWRRKRKGWFVHVQYAYGGQLAKREKDDLRRSRDVELAAACEVSKWLPLRETWAAPGALALACSCLLLPFLRSADESRWTCCAVCRTDNPAYRARRGAARLDGAPVEGFCARQIKQGPDGQYIQEPNKAGAGWAVLAVLAHDATDDGDSWTVLNNSRRIRTSPGNPQLVSL
ncbi:uncharacterized protein UV8b_06155 [Ustilaginoidea virens]|uniref:Uncharacterized protein n=1 Tax=Ustilaginoidea virens TaxID=1159556 RepID=A0A8E5HVC4_USTVR|nr:uncharacterized protein UV8b_06155 [Ustilaginoidea virens]QUC21914.1 hypothetical protein UV8b_06155 [Ustilaginoidea virens]